MGPDRKIYFSIGDRGTNAKAIDGSSVYLPDTGGVFRCNRDGSHLKSSPPACEIRSSFASTIPATS